MEHAPTDRIPSSLHSPSPLPLPLVLLPTNFSNNPHLINKHQKTFPLTMFQKSNREPDEYADDTLITFKSVGGSVRRILGYGYDMMNSKFYELKSLVGERMIWAVGAAALFLGMEMYVRKRDKRERQLLMMLLEEKDQRIANMLQQIALINDIRNLNSRIPAIRR